jgi:hypothetical protein
MYSYLHQKFYSCKKWVLHAGAMVRVVGGWLVDFWGMWCQIAAEVGCIGYAVDMGVGGRGSHSLAEMVGECGSLVEVDWR